MITKILEGDFGHGQLYVGCLNFLSVLCSEDGKLMAKLGSDAEGTVGVTELLDLPLHTGMVT